MSTNPTHPAYGHIAAFEVAKETLVIHIIPSDERHCIANSAKAIRKLLAHEMRRNTLRNLGPLLVVCEATGGYERHVLQVAMELKLACHKAHGARVRHFAKYLGLVAKTDPIDARVLALYGLKTEGLRLYAEPAIEQATLKELKTRRDQLQQMLIAESNRLEHAQSRSVVRSIKTHVTRLRNELKALEREIAAYLRSCEVLARKARLMRSVSGVGPLTATTLLAFMPELGTLAKAQTACLAGLAPINKDSGKAHIPRHIQAGRAEIRRSLYMAAVVALKSNSVMRDFAANLRARGKPFKVVITAVMRKLIVTLNAILRSGKPWRHAHEA